MYKDKVIELIQKVQVNSHNLEINNNSRFVEDLGFSSLNSIMLITLIGQTFDISIDDHLESLIEIQTVGDTVSYIHKIKLVGA